MLEESTSTAITVPGTTIETVVENSSQPTSCGNLQNQVQNNTHIFAQNTLFDGLVDDTSNTESHLPHKFLEQD